MSPHNNPQALYRNIRRHIPIRIRFRYPITLINFSHNLNYRVILLKKFNSEGCCELVSGLLRSAKASI